MPEIRAVFCDIDGTIVHDTSIMDSAKVAFQKLKENGIQVALCTGRSILHARRIQAELGMENCVFFNGGLTVHQENVLDAHPLNADVVERILRFTDETQQPFILHTLHKTIILREVSKKYMPLLREYDFPPLEYVDPQDWQSHDQDVFQVNVFMDKRWEQVVQNKVPECLIYRWNDEAVDLQKRGCDKSMGARVLLDVWGIRPEHALHIGDGGNDVGLFQAVGTSIAMGNAPDEVKQFATMTTANVEDDGMYHAMRRLNLID